MRVLSLSATLVEVDACVTHPLSQPGTPATCAWPDMVALLLDPPVLVRNGAT